MASPLSDHKVPSAFTQQFGRKKTTVKTFVSDKRERAITCVFCRDLHLTLTISGLFKRICLKEGKFGGKCFQTKLLSRLSHKVCRLLFSSVLLPKFTIDIFFVSYILRLKMDGIIFKFSDKLILL